MAVLLPPEPPPPASAPDSPSEYVTSRDITRRARISISTLYRWMEEGKFPRPALHLSAQQPRWATADIEAWEEAHREP